MNSSRETDVLVTGASGFIGARVAACLSGAWITSGTWHTNHAISVTNCAMFQLDVRTRQDVIDVIAKRLKPKVVVHIAGTKDIKYCQTHAEDAHQLHVEGTRSVVAACRMIGARVVYISTDCVFSGRKKAYVESDGTEPFNTYGETKRAGESIVLDSDLSSLVIRASLLFGWVLRGQASNYVIEVLRFLREQGSVEAATNLYNTPVLIDLVAETIAHIAMESSLGGIMHLAGRDRISRYEFAKSIARAFGHDESSVIPVVDRTGLRQPNSCLECRRLKKVTGKDAWGIAESLDHMIVNRSVPSRVKWTCQ